MVALIGQKNFKIAEGAFAHREGKFVMKFVDVQGIFYLFFGEYDDKIDIQENFQIESANCKKYREKQYFLWCSIGNEVNEYFTYDVHTNKFKKADGKLCQEYKTQAKKYKSLNDEITEEKNIKL
jgi:hypothetical protein